MWGWGLSEHVCPGQAWQLQARFSALRGAAPGLVEGSRFPRPRSAAGKQPQPPSAGSLTSSPHFLAVDILIMDDDDVPSWPPTKLSPSPSAAPAGPPPRPRPPAPYICNECG